MPQPTHQDVHVDALLTMLSIAYLQDPANYVSDRVFPVVPVRKQSNRIPEYTKADWFRDEAQLRAPATESEGSGYTVTSTTTYFCDNYAVHKDVPDEIRLNADEPFNPDVEATAFVTDRIRLRREKAWASDHFKTGVWGTDITVTNKWDDYGLSDPITDIETGRDTIHSTTSRDPRKLLVGRQVWSKLKHHPDFIERIKYTQRGVLTTEIVAAIVELDEILVGKAIEATSKEGATDVFAYVFGKNALLYFTPERPALLTPTAGYTFVWTSMGGLAFIRRIRDDKRQYDRIEMHAFFDHKALGTDLGYFFNAAVA